jgi:hypothetical protein
MQSSKVVFPAPEAPKRIVNPARARKQAFRMKLPWEFSHRLRMRTSSSEDMERGSAAPCGETPFTSMDPLPTACD